MTYRAAVAQRFTFHHMPGRSRMVDLEGRSIDGAICMAAADPAFGAALRLLSLRVNAATE